jgi:hypothetical protein
VPQLGVGGCTPSPRKLSAASERIAPAMPNVDCTVTICEEVDRHVSHGDQQDEALHQRIIANPID